MDLQRADVERAAVPAEGALGIHLQRHLGQAVVGRPCLAPPVTLPSTSLVSCSAKDMPYWPAAGAVPTCRRAGAAARDAVQEAERPGGLRGRGRGRRVVGQGRRRAGERRAGARRGEGEADGRSSKRWCGSAHRWSPPSCKCEWPHSRPGRRPARGESRGSAGPDDGAGFIVAITEHYGCAKAAGAKTRFFGGPRGGPVARCRLAPGWAWRPRAQGIGERGGRGSGRAPGRLAGPGGGGFFRFRFFSPGRFSLCPAGVFWPDRGGLLLRGGGACCRLAWRGGLGVSAMERSASMIRLINGPAGRPPPAPSAARPRESFSKLSATGSLQVEGVGRWGRARF